jgi:hypothetical protein
LTYFVQDRKTLAPRLTTALLFSSKQRNSNSSVSVQKLLFIPSIRMCTTTELMDKKKQPGKKEKLGKNKRVDGWGQDQPSFNDSGAKPVVENWERIPSYKLKNNHDIKKEIPTRRT